jgi:hypothetical protein
LFVSALVIAGCLSLFASGLPDGLERALADLGVESRDAAADEAPAASKAPVARVTALAPDYVWPGLADVPAQSVAGIAGVLVTFGVAWAAGRVLAQKGAGRP